MSVAVIVFTDGRAHIFDEERIHSWDLMLNGIIGERWIFDDSNDGAFARELARTFPESRVVSWPKRLGFGGSIAAAWELLNRRSSSEYFFHLEDDFVLEEPVNLRAMAGVLDRHPHLVQLALLRQAWNETEISAGGIVQCNPDAYTCCADEYMCWLEHRLFFTTNPSVYRRTLVAGGWPEGETSEGVFTHRLLREGTVEASGERIRFAFLGDRQAVPMVRHVGTVRAGTGY